MDTAASRRELEARARADERLRRQRGMLRPLGLVVIAAVAVGAFNGRPAPGLHGDGIGLLAAISAFALALAWASRSSFHTRPVSTQLLVIATMGAAAIALVALQPRGATELAGGAAVWFAVARLPLVLGVPLAIAVTVGLALALGLSGSSAAAIAAAILLCALLALVGYFIKQARASQDRTELLLAQLEDAREEQLRSAAVSERARIAAELHDLLAHSLSGAAIQLQGARKLAERDHAPAQVGAVIERAAELVREGLTNARQAVGALRGETLPGVNQLDALVSTFRRDTETEVTFTVEGDARTLPADASLALYRGAQEALTNIARYAPGAATTIVLRYERGCTSLGIENGPAATRTDGLLDVGGQHGLAGLRERVEATGGSLYAGATATGWRVVLQVPA